MARAALLLGVDAYEESSLRLPAAGRDIKDLAESLALAGFDPQRVRAVGGGDGDYLSTNKLRKLIREFLNGPNPGDELLVYFSGHGVEWSGHRLLIPQDYDLTEPSPRSDLIGDLDLYALARASQCRADSVLFVIDACRQDIRLAVVDTKGPEPLATAQTGDPDSPSIAFVLSCGPGEYSHANSGDAPFSYFTRALCEALKADDSLSTLSELCGAVQERLSGMLQPKGLSQTVTSGELRAAGRGGDPECLVIKESPAARLRQLIERSDWVRRAARGPVWDLAAGASAGLADQLCTLIQRCESIRHEARVGLPRQRWGDDRAPARVLRCLEILLGDGVTNLLSPPEAAVAVLIPHLYEALLAAALLNLTEHGDPLAADGYPPTACRMALALRGRIAAEAAWERRRALLRDRGQTEAADDLAAWQTLRFLHESGELWDYSPGRPAGTRGWVNERLDALFALAPLPAVGAEPRVPRVLDGARLVGLVRLAFAGFEDIRLESGREPPQGLDPRRCFGQGQGSNLWCLDEPKLAHLLNLAFGLALDPRRLPPVLAEHLGVDPQVSAESLATSLAKAEWQLDESSALILALDCPHEALDSALETQVAQLAEHLHRLAREEVLAADLLARLPRRISDSRVAPVREGEGPRYRRPHLAFSMDQGRVRELLMGETLYGKPELALRELYQNALDACRWRRTRERWLRTTGGLDEHTPVYSGLIRFGAGRDGGRAYIECEDNGIGMTDRHLRGLFARAGRRFADSHEFHLEQADWDAAGIPFYPNSRFGIGVLSYFMLADELLVESRRLKPDGVDWEPGLRARVVGSGSLFRIQPLAGPRQGTRVRLYLNRGDWDSAKLLDGMTEWLWVPEFDTEIAGSALLRLQAGEPAPGMVKACGALVPIPERAADAGQVRAWWGSKLIRGLRERERGGPLLSDGIRVAPGPEQQRRSGTLGSPGLVANLTGSLRPGLSVDRNEIVDWSVGEEWLEKLVASHGWQCLPGVEGVGILALGDLFYAHPLAVTRLDRALREGALGMRQLPWAKGKALLDASVGLFEQDAPLDPEPREDRWFRVRALSSHEIPAHGKTESRLLRARLAALIRAGLEVPAPLAWLCKFPWGGDGLNPRAGAWVLIAQYLDIEARPEGQTWPAEMHVTRSAAGLCAFANHRSIPIAQAIELVSDLPEISLDPDTRERILQAPALNTIQATLLSRDNDGRKPWRDAISLSHLVVAAAQSRKPLGEIVELARPLAGLGVSLPDLDRLRKGLVLDEKQRLILTRDLDGTAPWLNAISPIRVAVAAEQWSMPIGAVIDLVQPLAELGLGPANLDAIPRDLALDSRLVQLLSRDLGEGAPFLSAAGLYQIARAARRWSMPINKVADLVRPLVDLGLEAPGLGRIPSNLVLGETQMELLEAGMEGRVSPANLLRIAAEMRSHRLSELIDLARPLADLGIEVEPLPPETEPWLRDLGVLRVLSLLAAHIDWDGEYLDPLPLAYRCVDSNRDPTDFRDALSLLKAIGFDVDECIAYVEYCAQCAASPSPGPSEAV